MLALSRSKSGLISLLLSHDVGRDSLLPVLLNSGLDGVTGEARGDDLRKPLGEDPKRSCKGTAVWLGDLMGVSKALRRRA